MGEKELNKLDLLLQDMRHIGISGAVCLGFEDGELVRIHWPVDGSPDPGDARLRAGLADVKIHRLCGKVWLDFDNGDLVQVRHEDALQTTAEQLEWQAAELRRKARAARRKKIPPTPKRLEDF